MDLKLIGDSVSPQISQSDQQAGKKGPESFILALLLLREVRDPSPELALHKVFEGVGLVVLGFTTVQHFQKSDWFLEAVEQDVVIV